MKLVFRLASIVALALLIWYLGLFATAEWIEFGNLEKAQVPPLVLEPHVPVGTSTDESTATSSLPDAPEPAPPGDDTDEPVVCTMDAKICPDGSAVGRVGPNCEFAPCSTPTPSESIVCAPEQRNVDACIEIYQPVCGAVRVECITEPCDPVPETFSNSCFACQNDRVISYTEGACEVDI